MGFGDRSLPPAVRESGRRSVGNRKERLVARLCEFPGLKSLGGFQGGSPDVPGAKRRKRVPHEAEAPCIQLAKRRYTPCAQFLPAM